MRAEMYDKLVSGKGERRTISAKDDTDVLLRYLEQLKDARAAGENSFLYGEQTAYTECLEWIGLWEYAAEHGLDFDIEKRYPL